LAAEAGNKSIAAAAQLELAVRNASRGSGDQMEAGVR